MKHSELHVDFRKWPAAPHWRFTVQALGSDSYGHWFCVPQGSLMRRGNEPPKRYPRTSTMLVARDVWWVAFWSDNRSQPYDVYIDITTPPQLSAELLTTVDLELDVVRKWNGDVEIIDWDDFSYHQELLNYPSWLVRTAEHTAARLARVIKEREEPFGVVGPSWLAKATAREVQQRSRAG